MLRPLPNAALDADRLPSRGADMRERGRRCSMANVARRGGRRWRRRPGVLPLATTTSGRGDGSGHRARVLMAWSPASGARQAVAGDAPIAAARLGTPARCASGERHSAAVRRCRRRPSREVPGRTPLGDRPDSGRRGTATWAHRSRELGAHDRGAAGERLQLAERDLAGEVLHAAVRRRRSAARRARARARARMRAATSLGGLDRRRRRGRARRG